jgi:hypothetical protein
MSLFQQTGLSDTGAITVTGTVATSGTTVVQLQDASLVSQKQVYQVSFDYNLASTGEKLVFHLNNPSNSGKTVKLTDMFFTLTNSSVMVAILRVYVNPTITGNGNALTISPAYIGASQPSSVMAAYSGPSASANGTQYLSNMVASGTSGSSFVFSQEGYLLAPGSKLLLTGNPDGVNRNLSLTVRWAEI